LDPQAPGFLQDIYARHKALEIKDTSQRLAMPLWRLDIESSQTQINTVSTALLFIGAEV
jgi:hypothetical protein